MIKELYYFGPSKICR